MVDPDRAGGSRKVVIGLALAALLVVVVPLAISGMLVGDPQPVIEVAPPPVPVLSECEGVALSDVFVCTSESTFDLSVMNSGIEVAGLQVVVRGSNGLHYVDLPFAIDQGQLHHGVNYYNASIGEVTEIEIVPYVGSDTRSMCPHASFKIVPAECVVS